MKKKDPSPSRQSRTYYTVPDVSKEPTNAHVYTKPQWETESNFYHEIPADYDRPKAQNNKEYYNAAYEHDYVYPRDAVDAPLVLRPPEMARKFYSGPRHPNIYAGHHVYYKAS